MLSALLTRYKTPVDKHFSKVTGVTEVQASNGKTFACYPTKLAGVTEVTRCADDLLPVTPVTPDYPAEVTAKALPRQTCTPVTSVTPQKQRYPQECEAPAEESTGFPGTALIMKWLASIGEDDRAIIGETIDQCAHDPEALEYFTRRAAEHLQKNAGNAALLMSEDGADDDRITCAQCLMLAFGGACMAAKRGELMTATSRNYRPDLNRMRRCEEYLPRGGGDTRPGRERWPGLTDMKGGE